MYEEGAGTDRMHQKWFAKFHAGDCSLDDAPWLGRPIGVDSDQIETLVENNQRYTTQKIADKLKIFKSIKLLVNMKKFVFYITGEKITHTCCPMILSTSSSLLCNQGSKRSFVWRHNSSENSNVAS